MATAIQKNGIKSLSNGNGLVQDLQTLTGYSDVVNTGCAVGSGEHGLQAGGEIDLQQEYQEELVQEQQQTDEPEIDIVINNVVCSFSVRCHLNLREIALNGTNVEYRKENGMITMKIRRPYTTASIWSSGKVTCTGATSEIQAKIAARRFARCLQKLGFNVRFNNYRVVNVLGTCCMPFGIKINTFAKQHRNAEYEPELHPGLTYKLKQPKATLKIFSTGSITVTAPSVDHVQAAIEHIFPLVYDFRKERTHDELQSLKRRKHNQVDEEPTATTTKKLVTEQMCTEVYVRRGGGCDSEID